MKCKWSICLSILQEFENYNVFVYIGDSDPCLSSNHGNLHKAGWRGSECGYTFPGICDKRITPGWYSVKGADDKSYRQMVEGPVDMSYCGAVNPISLQTKGCNFHSLYAFILLLVLKELPMKMIAFS